MLRDDDFEAIKGMAIRGRLALALTCIERALVQYDVHDERITELVDALWGFVEQDDVVDAEDVAMETRAMDLLDAIEFDTEIPESYRGLPEFLPNALYDALWIGVGNMYAAVTGYSQQTFRPTVHILELCEQHGVPLPDLAPFTRLPITEDEGWGRRMPRSFFKEAQ